MLTLTHICNQNEDSPVDAQASEEKPAKDDKEADSAPEAETKPDEKDTPSEKKRDESPSDLGDARQTSKVRTTPEALDVDADVVVPRMARHQSSPTHRSRVLLFVGLVTLVH